MSELAQEAVHSDQPCEEILDPHTGDIFVDPDGKAWIVRGRYESPVVTMSEIPMPSILISLNPDGSVIPDDPPKEKIGGVNGSMWNGWKRIHRHPGVAEMLKRERGYSGG